MARPAQSSERLLYARNRTVAFFAFIVWLSSTALSWAAVNAESNNYYTDAQAYLKKGDINAAAVQLKNAIRADEGNVEARFDLAAIYVARLDGASAEAELRAALTHGIARERVLL